MRGALHPRLNGLALTRARNMGEKWIALLTTHYSPLTTHAVARYKKTPALAGENRGPVGTCRRSGLRSGAHMIFRRIAAAEGVFGCFACVFSLSCVDMSTGHANVENLLLNIRLTWK